MKDIAIYYLGINLRNIASVIANKGEEVVWFGAEGTALSKTPKEIAHELKKEVKKLEHIVQAIAALGEHHGGT